MKSQTSIEEELLEKINRSFITKSYNFDNLNLSSLNFLDKYICPNQIKVFSAIGNELLNLPARFMSQIKSIKLINLSKNKFNTIDDSITNIIEVFTLNMRTNLISKIPGSIQQLVFLKDLDLSNNLLTSIPDESFLSLFNLEILKLSYNKFLDFPFCLAYMEKLEILYIDHNAIDIILDDIWQTSKLQTLDISFNKLQYLGEGFLSESEISNINLKGNLITRIELYKMPGYEVFETRRKQRKDQGFDRNLEVDFELCGLDEK
jgi:Leucine-rich repeat (LRR) protein